MPTLRRTQANLKTVGKSNDQQDGLEPQLVCTRTDWAVKWHRLRACRNSTASAGQSGGAVESLVKIAEATATTGANCEEMPGAGASTTPRRSTQSDCPLTRLTSKNLSHYV
jgi:hypothetical protein